MSLFLQGWMLQPKQEQVLSIRGGCALPSAHWRVFNAVRPTLKRYKGSSISLKSNLIRVTPMTLNLPLSNDLSYCYNLSFFHEGSLGAFHVLVKCSWSQSLPNLPLIVSSLWCKIELLLQCMLYPSKEKPFPTVNRSGSPQNKWIKEHTKKREREKKKKGIFIKRKKIFSHLFLKCEEGKLKGLSGMCQPAPLSHSWKREMDWPAWKELITVK